MVGERFDFDELARDLAGGLSRREALRRLGGGVAGALLASLGLGQRAFSAPAANSGCQDFCRNTCGVKPGGGNAFGQCISSCEQCLNSSSTVCACPAPGSTAVVCCPVGQNCCGGHCCASGQYCCGSQCSVCPCDQSLCSGSQGTNCCTAGQTCCDGACVNTQSDPNHCGTCGDACPAGQSCAKGACSGSIARLGPTCTTCGTECVDLQSNPFHCGSCDHRCGTLVVEVCLGGTCQPPSITTGEGGSSPTAQCGQCGGACTDLSSDPKNCGSCGYVCPANNACVGGACFCDSGSVCGGQCCPPGADCVSGQCQCGFNTFACGTTAGGAPAACCDMLSEACQNGSCVACSNGVACGGQCCPANAICHFGECQCQQGYFECGGNFGSPAACCSASAEVCVNGTCATCPEGQAACLNRCCPAHATCFNGQCVCASGYSACGTGPAACCSNATETCISAVGFCTSNVVAGP